MSLRTRSWMSAVVACSLLAAPVSLFADEMKEAPASETPASEPASTPATPATPTTPATTEPAMSEPIPAAPAGIPVPEGEVVHSETREGGLLVEDLKIGEGYEVQPNGAVVAHYHGTRKNDAFVFDSSFQRGEPVAFPLSGVIPGWQQGVPGMKVGGVRRLTIPAALGYGERGAGANIPPNTDLVFIIQLVDALQIEDIKVGEGEAVEGRAVAVATFTVKDADGKVVEEATAAKPYIWLPGEFQAIDFGLEGMKVGGVRKIHVPKEMNVTAPQLQTTRPPGVPLDIELELIAVRNLNATGPRR